MILSLGNDFNRYTCQGWADLGASFPIVDDRSAALWSIFGDGTVPRNVIIDAEGVVLYNSTIFNEESITDILDGALSVDDHIKVPRTNRLLSTYPNPFNSGTQIEVLVGETGTFELDIYNIRGEWVSRLFSGELNSGEYTFRWQGADNNGLSVPSGVYIIRFVSEQDEDTRRTLLLK